jgi:hypothetical protein
VVNFLFRRDDFKQIGTSSINRSAGTKQKCFHTERSGLSVRNKGTKMIWPSKDEREEYEIEGFIELCKRPPESREFIILEKREKPDYFIKDQKTNEIFGVELTSVYLSDLSVPDEHIQTLNENPQNIPFNREEIEEYKLRIISAIRDKVEKAKLSYDQRYPLILSVYVDEYRSIFMGRKEWEQFVTENEPAFDAMGPFTKIFFWSLANNDALIVTPRNSV